MTLLIKYDAARRALAEAHRVDEVKEFHDQAAAMKKYAEQAKDGELIRLATEIKLRAERRAGELLIEMAERGERHRGSQDQKSESRPATPILADFGINKTQSSRWQKLATIPEEKFEEKVAKIVAKAADIVEGKKTVRGTAGTGENEWYTPGKYIEAARRVLGNIDLDPASCEAAQTTVKARQFYTAEDDGLAQKWQGRVWLNPPYAQPYMAHFVEKMLSECKAGRIEQAIMLTHNYSDTAWFQDAAAAADAICFPRGRIKFINSDGEEAAPTQGQTFFYFGPDPIRFASVFGEFGFVTPAPYQLGNADIINFSQNSS